MSLYLSYFQVMHFKIFPFNNIKFHGSLAFREGIFFFFEEWSKCASTQLLFYRTKIVKDQCFINNHGSYMYGHINNIWS